MKICVTKTVAGEYSVVKSLQSDVFKLKMQKSMY